MLYPDPDTTPLNNWIRKSNDFTGILYPGPNVQTEFRTVSNPFEKNWIRIEIRKTNCMALTKKLDKK